MPSDYKQRPARKKAPARASRKKTKAPSRLPAFVAGLVLGVIGTISAFVYEPGESITQVVESVAPSGGKSGGKPTKFEFYTVLPDKEIAIPDTEVDEPVAAPPPPKDVASAPVQAAAASAAARAESYMLQVGSFRSLEDADRLKARLALLGLESSIQTVSLDGREKWHRVHVGPYQGRVAVAEARTRLQENDFEAMTLKLK